MMDFVPYELKATLLDSADRSDPLNQLVVIGVKLTGGPMVEVGGEGWEERDGLMYRFDHLGNKMEVSAKKRVKHAWGLKVCIRSDRGAARFEDAIAGLVKLLILNPPPPDILDAIKDARTPVAAECNAWFDLQPGVPAKEIVVG